MADRAMEIMEGGVIDWGFIQKSIYLPPAVSKVSHEAYFLMGRNGQQERK